MMDNRRVGLFLPIAVIAAILLAAGVPVRAQGDADAARADAFAESAYRSASQCAPCHQQIVVEVATAQVIEGENEPGRPALGDQYALGFRYQLPITKALIVRADGMYGFREFDDDIRGLRLELRRRF